MGPFMEFVSKCAANELFVKLCPMSESMRDRYEDEELVVRFFAYSDRYSSFRHDVEKFLNKYVLDIEKNFDEETMSNEFNNMLIFVNKFFPHGFSKKKESKTTPRVRFEAIGVGVNLALRENPDLTTTDVKSWIYSSEFEEETTTHASNSLPLLRSRVEYVRDKVLGNS